MNKETNISMGGGSYGISTWRGLDPNEKPREWIHDFFGGKRDFYGTAYRAVGTFEKRDADAEVEAVINTLKAGTGSHILDWCGGWGRHAVPLAKRGYKVTLLDFSKEYLEHAGDYAAREGVTLNLVHADFRETPPEIQADYAVNIFTAGIGYLGEENDILALRSLKAALKPGGRILIDTMNLFWIVKNFIERSWLESADGTKRFLEKRTFDFSSNSVEAESVFTEIEIGASAEKQAKSKLRLYSPADLARILKSAGFTPAEFFGDLDGSKFELNSKRVVMTALRLE